jgi:hypothetical protein
MRNEVYTDLEDIVPEYNNGSDGSLYHFVFHFNPFTGLWSAIHRDDYLQYWSNSNNPRVIRSKSFSTLQEIIIKTGGDLNKIDQLTREQ